MLLLIIGFLLCNTIAFPQSDKDFDKLKVYAIPWDVRYCKPIRTIDNLRSTYLFYFEASNDIIDLGKMFLNYDDCFNKLSSFKELKIQDINNKKATNVLVELYFSNSKYLSLFFDKDGNYFFYNKWYCRNDGLFYMIFKYFSNEIISEKTLKKAKNKFVNELWHNEN